MKELVNEHVMLKEKHIVVGLFAWFEHLIFVSLCMLYISFIYLLILTLTRRA